MYVPTPLPRRGIIIRNKVEHDFDFVVLPGRGGTNANFSQVSQRLSLCRPLGVFAPQTSNEWSCEVDKVVREGHTSSLPRQCESKLADITIGPASPGTRPFGKDSLLHGHHSVKVGNQSLISDSRDIGVGGSPMTLNVFHRLRIDLDERTHFNVGSVNAASNDVAGLGGDHEPADLGLARIHSLRRGFDGFSCQGCLDIETKQKPRFSQRAVSLPPVPQSCVDTLD